MDEMLKPLPIVLQNVRESLAISVEIGCCMHEPANELDWISYICRTQPYAHRFGSSNAYVDRAHALVVR